MIKEEAPSIFLWTQYDMLGISKKVAYQARGDEWLWLFDAKPKKGGTRRPDITPTRPMTALRQSVRRVRVARGVCRASPLVTFLILHASGDPVSLIMPEAPEADRAVLRKALGLDQPLAVQFARFVTSSLRGDFGKSFFHREPAAKLVLERMPTTLTLTLLAMALALVVALPVGIFSAVRRNSALDHAATVTVFLGQSMPVFLTGIMLILLFGVHWRVLPVSGWATWTSAVLPTVTLGAPFGAAPPAHRPLQHAGGHQPRLRADGPGQGRDRVARHLPARPAQRGAAPGDGGWAAVRPPSGRGGHHGDGLRGAGCGAAHRGGDPPARLPRGAGRACSCWP